MFRGGHTPFAAAAADQEEQYVTMQYLYSA